MNSSYPRMLHNDDNCVVENPHVTRTFVDELRLAQNIHVDKFADYYIRIIWQMAFIIWSIIFGLILSTIAYTTQTRKFIRYVKYANPKNDINKKLFTQVKQEFSTEIGPQKFTQEFNDFLKEELNKYYK